jgi:hypothetical protein
LVHLVVEVYSSRYKNARHQLKPEKDLSRVNKGKVVQNVGVPKLEHKNHKNCWSKDGDEQMVKESLEEELKVEANIQL